MSKKLIIGTRGSPLAMVQARMIAEFLDRLGLKNDICAFTTKGDQLKDQPLCEVGGKGLFCKEIDEALLRHEVDLAVHSVKDLPARLPEGLRIAAFLKRADPRDAFISRDARTLMDLESGAIVGTASIRRRVQLLALRPDLQVVLLRGNVGTRLEKLMRGEVDATFLAVAGLQRLGRTDVISQVMKVREMIPAVGQGAICVVTRIDDFQTFESIKGIHDGQTEIRVMCERTLLRELDGDCRTPLAGYASFEKHNGKINLVCRGMLADASGKTVVRAEMRGQNPVALGKKIARVLRRNLQKDSNI